MGTALEGTVSPWFVFEETARKYPGQECIWSRDGCYTYKQLYESASQYGHYFLSEGIRPGQLVAVYLTNRPEFLVAWLGLWSIGCAPAAINYNLAGDGLVHCLKVSDAKLLLVDSDTECRARIEGSRSAIEQDVGMKIVHLDEGFKKRIDSSFPKTPADEKYRKNVDGAFPAILLYTSGTTGLPKGCAYTMQRLMAAYHARGSAMASVPGPDGDRWYSPMPLYHGTAAIIAIAQLIGGQSVCIGRKFSVRNFWPDIRDSRATFFVYVGETARYLLNAPPSPLDKEHSVRCIYGNGLRPDIWERFRDRFGIPEVAEFFNSTEGMFGLLNRNRGPYLAGAVGHHGLIQRLLFHNAYVPVAIDPESGDILRDPKTGFAIREPYDKGGEILVAVPNEEAFQGYWKNPNATSKKFLRDVFRKGDIFYRTGDALRRSDDGRWFFLDRLGDTFRWRSENVSTAEVAEVLGKFPGIQEANVYGVKVPGYEGRAGCAALQIEGPRSSSSSPSDVGIDLKELASYAHARLPKYAVPVFLRIGSSSLHIHNNKQNKVPLREEGADPEKLGTKVPGGEKDRLWVLYPGSDRYVPFGKEEWEKIKAGTVKL